MAEALLKGNMGVQDIRSPMQGLAQLANTLVGGLQYRKAQEDAASGRDKANAELGRILSGGSDASMGDLSSVLGNPWASDAQQQLASMLIGEQIKRNQSAAPEFGFTFAPDGSLIRTDKTSGSFETLGQFGKAEPGFKLLSPEEAAANRLDPNKAWQVGPDNRVYEVGGGGVNVTVGDGAPGLGKLSTDFGYVLDPTTGKPKIDPATGLPTAAAIPGSPAAMEAAAAAAKANAGADSNAIATDTITNAAALARDIANKPFTTGLAGGLASNLSESDAAELRRQVGVLTANATIENLNAMRQASPTGGALGSVTEKEGAMLAAASGAIDPNSKPEDFRRQLDNYERTLLRIVNGPEAGDRIFEATRKQKDAPEDSAIWAAPAPPQGWGGKPELWEFMTPEQRALWK